MKRKNLYKEEIMKRPPAQPSDNICRICIVTMDQKDIKPAKVTAIGRMYKNTSWWGTKMQAVHDDGTIHTWDLINK